MIVTFPDKGWLYAERIWSDTYVGKPPLERHSRQRASVGLLTLLLPKNEFKMFMRLAKGVKETACSRVPDLATELAVYDDPELNKIIATFPESPGLIRAILAPSGLYDRVGLYRRMRDTRMFAFLDEQEFVYYIDDVPFTGKKGDRYNVGALILTSKRFLFDPNDPMVTKGAILEMPFEEGGLPVITGGSLPEDATLRFSAGGFSVTKKDAQLLGKMATRLSILHAQGGDEYEGKEDVT